MYGKPDGPGRNEALYRFAFSGGLDILWPLALLVPEVLFMSDGPQSQEAHASPKSPKVNINVTGVLQACCSQMRFCHALAGQ
jgi:hypothetical protein